ncbi:MAG: integrin alpha [Phycisphaerae bacterium]|nr:integrin alpha [Phycisphaerae bacterium]
MTQSIRCLNVVFGVWICLGICLGGNRTIADDAMVLSHTKISSSAELPLNDDDRFGVAMASIGDLDGDGIADIAVGASTFNGNSTGAVWILFMNTDGTVKTHQKIDNTSGIFSGALDVGDRFGHAVASLGDLDGDGITDIAVGADSDDDGGTCRGAVWILFLNTNGTVKSYQKISNTQGNFHGMLDDLDTFGYAITSVGDLDGDHATDIVVGVKDDDGGTDRGGLWVLFLNSNGTVKTHQKISDTNGNFMGILANGDWFGINLNSIGDLNGDGITDIAVGARRDDDGGPDRGAVWILFLNVDGTVISHQKISATTGGFTGELDDQDEFGSGIAALGDVDNDGILDIAVGAFMDDDGGNNHGAVWILCLNTDGTVKAHSKISNLVGNFNGELNEGDRIGHSITSPGDLDGDGQVDLAVGSWGDDDGGKDRGAVWMLRMSWRCADTFDLAGDWNKDCRVDLLDFSIMCNNWLINCYEDPDNPACAMD